MGKRAASPKRAKAKASTPASPKRVASPKKNDAKKAKVAPAVDPIFASVSDAIMEAEQIPARTRTMLVEMLPFSLKFASDERHELQTMAIDMVEQTLIAKKSALEAGVEAEKLALTRLQASESKLGIAVEESTTALAAQNDVVSGKATVLASTMEAEAASKAKLSDLQKASKDAEEKFSVMKSEKESITAAFAEHFDPMEAGEGKAHFKKLEPFLKKIDIESTLLQALPSSCAKAKDKRGTFDHLVLENLKTAFNAKIAALSQAIEAEGPASIQRASDLAGAEADLTAKTAAREQAASECDAAGKEQSDRESALKAAKQAVEDFQPNLKDTTARLAASEKAFAEFEATPFANFASLKSRVAAVPEAEEAPVDTAAADDAPMEEAVPAADGEGAP